jgi:hypothetical protein
MSTRVKLVAPLVAWTWFLWGSRIRNISGNETLSGTGQFVRILIAIVFLAFGFVIAVRMWQRRSDTFTPADRTLLMVFVVWSVGFWLARGIGIIVDDHTVAFIAVHTVLMVISIALALNAVRAVSNRSISSSRLVAQ